MGPVFSEFLFVRFFQRPGEETKDQRYWPTPKFQELLMQLSFYVPPDQSLIKKGNTVIMIRMYPFDSCQHSLVKQSS